MLPKLRLHTRNEIKLEDYKCEFVSEGKNTTDNICMDIYSNLTKSFSSKIVTFKDGQYWDQPSSYRFIAGLVRNYNEYATTYAASVHLDINNSTKNVNVMLNCNKTNI
jgi:hypothetical protein